MTDIVERAARKIDPSAWFEVGLLTNEMVMRRDKARTAARAALLAALDPEDEKLQDVVLEALINADFTDAPAIISTLRSLVEQKETE